MLDDRAPANRRKCRRDVRVDEAAFARELRARACAPLIGAIQQWRLFLDIAPQAIGDRAVRDVAAASGNNIGLSPFEMLALDGE
jgi:hypothetical protein